MKSLKINRNGFDVYFTSDLHYGHRNLVLDETKWIKDRPAVWSTNYQREEYCEKYGVRNFKTVHQMNELIIKNINDVVGEDDHIFFLGDMAFGPDNSLRDLMSSIVCQNRYLVFGNHDKALVLNKNGERGFFKRCDHTMFAYIDGQGVYMNHYAHRVWNKSHRGSWHLYGHSHGRLNGDWGKSMDVGVDTNDFKPYSFDTLSLKMSKKEIKVVDHHGTNRED